MKLEVQDTNYAATIVRVGQTTKLEGLDNLVALPFFGFQALVPKTTQSGDLGVLFTAETQLSEEFCAKNNLFRHSEKNADKDAKGYLEDNRRVRAIKLRGHTSSALFLSIDSLAVLGITGLKEGDTFTHIDGVEICKKYRKTQPRTRGEGNRQKKSRIIDALFPKHFDTEQFFKNYKRIPDGSLCIVTQKVHGTSGRFAHQVVKRQLSWAERWAKWLGFKVQETECAYFCGTRNTTKDPEATSGHYYQDNVWASWLEKIKHKIPKNWIVYGEIFGYTESGQPIQKNYTYTHDVGQSSLAVYRISVVNEDGVAVDLPWDSVVAWCKSADVGHVAEMFRFYLSTYTELDTIEALVSGVGQLMDKKYCEMQLYKLKVAHLSPESPCDEGVCIRVDNGPVPLILKAKSPLFLQHETKCLDKGEVDIEEEASLEDADVLAGL